MTLVCDPTARGKVPETRWSVLLGLLLSLALGVVTPAFALTTYYVAPNWAGSQNGTASQPWTSLSTSGAWTAINASLATDDVTVYFTARKAASDTDETTTTQLSLNRNNGSTHRLTLDGMSQYNTNNAAPSWAAYSGNSRFTVNGGANPGLASNNLPTGPQQNRVTIRGFKFNSTTNQAAIVANIPEFIFELNTVTNTGSIAGGNALLLASQNDVPGTFGTNVIIRNNIIGPAPAECFYVGGYYNTGADSSAVSWTNLLIENNTIVDSGRTPGEEGNGIDVKEGSVNTIIRGNIVQQITPPPGLNSGGITVDSVAIIEGNLVTGYGAGIVTSAAYNNTNGRTNAEIRNNIVAGNVTGGDWGGSGIVIRGANTSGTRWTGLKIYNNTSYNNAGNGLDIVNDAFGTTNITVQNNIFAGNSSLQLSAPSGNITTHSNNLYWKSSGTLVSNGGSTFTTGTIANYEATALAVNPVLVNPIVSAGAIGFKLQATSPAIGTAITLGSFSNDYMGQIRIVPWDRGSWAFSSATSTQPQPPTFLSVR